MKQVAGFLILLLPGILFAQNRSDSGDVVKLNQVIDDAVVGQNILALDTLYADDFVFSHGSGKVQDKKAWLNTVGKTMYPLRNHDSVTAEMHHELAIVKGKMNIERVDKATTARYYLKYIRVYVLRKKRWQLISHSTTLEVHEP